MLFFIIILGCIGAFFAALLEFNRQFGLENDLPYPVYRQIPIAFFTQILFILIYNFQNYLFILVCGIFFILAGFYYLGIIHFSKMEFKYHFTLQTMLISVVSAVSGLVWQQAIWGIICFILTFAFFYSILKKANSIFLKSRKNVSELLELFKIINGIFMFILGLVVASDRIRFLKKIINWFLTG